MSNSKAELTNKAFEARDKLQSGGGLLNCLSLEEARTLLAHEMWADGMEWQDVLLLWDGKNEIFTCFQIIAEYLEYAFGY